MTLDTFAEKALAQRVGDFAETFTINMHLYQPWTGSGSTGRKEGQ